MSDLFHKDVPDSYVEAVVEVMSCASWHTYQVLTKRSERMASFLAGSLLCASQLEHVWWGVSVENRKHGLPRIEDLRSAPAKIRFLSIEPLLEDLGEVNLEGISWVIVGGESGHGARPMKESWVLGIRDQCKGASVPFFFKQWGGVHKKATGRLLRGRTYDETPRLSTRRAPELEEQVRAASRFRFNTMSVGCERQVYPLSRPASAAVG